MKKFIEPEINIHRFSTEVLLDDSTTGNNGDNTNSSVADVENQLKNDGVNGTIFSAAWNEFA